MRELFTWSAPSQSPLSWKGSNSAATVSATAGFCSQRHSSMEIIQRQVGAQASQREMRREVRDHCDATAPTSNRGREEVQPALFSRGWGTHDGEFHSHSKHAKEGERGAGMVMEVHRARTVFTGDNRVASVG